MRTLTWNLFATIRMARLGLGLLAAISIPLLWASPTRAGTTLTSSMCPVVIAQSGEYDLATDVGPCPPGVDGIVIQASAVTLRLNGHTISGTATSGTCNSSNGVRVGLPAPMPMLSQVRVLGDGMISNFSVGFRAENSAGSLVKFLTVTAQCSSASDGFLIMAPGGQWKLQGNVVREPAAFSIGIFLSGVDDNDLVGNDVNNSIFLANSSNNTVVNNTASDDLGGIFLSGSTGSNSNEIHANTTNNNTGVGSLGGLRISLGSSANNTTGNKSFNNDPSDMEDDNPNCDSNKWEGNQFGTANQPCIH